MNVRLTTEAIGMHDNLTNYLVDRTRSSTPFVIKYVPYGSLSEVRLLYMHHLFGLC